MSTKEDKTMGETSNVQVRVEMPYETNSRGAKANNFSTVANKCAIFNKQTTKLVIFWGGISFFFVGVLSGVISFLVPVLMETSLGGLEKWQWSLLIATILGGPGLSIAINNLIMFSLNREFVAKENLIYYVVGLVENAWVVLWFGMIFLSWTWIIAKPSYLDLIKKKKVTLLHGFGDLDQAITSTLITMLLGSFAWLIKNVLIMMIKSKFLITWFYDKIRESLVHEYRIRALTRNKRGQQSFLPHKLLLFKGDKNICRMNRELEVDLLSLEVLDREDVSCWTIKILTDEMIKGRPLVCLDEGIIQPMETNCPAIRKLYMQAINIIGFKKENTNKIREVYVEKEYAISNEKDVGKVAKKIFFNLVGEVQDQREKEVIARKEGNIDDAQNCKESELATTEKALSSYFSAEEKVEVKNWLLDGVDTKQIDKEVFTECVKRAWKHRTALVRSLQGYDQHFQNLHIFLDVVIAIIIFIFWPVMLNLDFERVTVTVGSSIGGLALLLGSTTTNLLYGFTFVFMAHPFDVGDCCLIEDLPMAIEELNLLTTKASTLDGETKLYKNSELRYFSISNYTRSPSGMEDNVVFFLDISAPEDTIVTLKELINSYIVENSHYWRPEHELLSEFDTQEPTKMRVTLRVKYNICYHDYQERQAQKSILISEVLKYLNALRLVPSQDTMELGEIEWVLAKSTDQNF